MRTLIFLFCAVTLFFGCSGSESSSNRRGKLSDAAEAASDRHTGERIVDAEFRPSETESATEYIDTEAHTEGSAPERHDSLPAARAPRYSTTLSRSEYLDSIDLADSPKYSNTGVQDESSNRSPAVGLTAASGFLSSNEFYGMSTFGISLHTPVEDGITAEFGAEIAFAPLQRTSSLSHSIDDGVLLLEASVQFHLPVTPEHTFIGQYLFAGAGANVMLWTYKNPIKAPVYSHMGTLTGYETITSDQLGGVDLFTGIGLDLTQTLPFHLAAEFRPGVVLWTGTTSEGFDNDLFANFAYVQFRIKVTFETE